MNNQRRRPRSSRRVGVAALTGVILLAGAVLAQAYPPGNRVVNPGAEDATLTGWEQDGFASVEYGSAARYPAAARPGFFGGGDGERLFAASVTGARLTQTVEVTDLAASIDAGDQVLYGGADLGAAAGSNDTIELTFQPLDASGDLLGQPVVIGRPTNADRGGTTSAVPCETRVGIAPGVRGVQVTLVALGAPGANLAFADAVYLSTQSPPAPPPIERRPADGPGCRTNIPPEPPPQPPPASPCGNPDAAGYLHPAKLRVSRARVMGEDRRLDVLAPITSRARGGDVPVTYQGDGRSDTFDAEVTQSNTELDHIRFREPITRGQAELGTGIVNLHYLGDADTRPDFVRLRAASQRAELDVEEISLIGDRLSAKGSVTSRAEGIVRLRYSYLNPDGTPNVHEARAEIQDDGDWELIDDQVPAQIAQCGGYLSIQFTGYLPQRIRGEQLAYQLDAGQTRRP
jgi:hypothetical protein